jgi:hypothetical protein
MVLIQHGYGSNGQRGVPGLMPSRNGHGVQLIPEHHLDGIGLAVHDLDGIGVYAEQWTSDLIGILLYDLEGNLRAMLKTTKIYLRVSVRPDDAPVTKVPYMPSEKAGELMKTNPEVNSLVKDLGLEIK